ncbi:SDR family NAD(P)-dependent oxidoreductase [Dactylosporangium sp. NBC_01737]|uniref:SDR family NAD(P)-dependent oxidoreductase n=1 Tax=Dactylosporangium sp. NBC_01737 TaxID=2975959 RepID=UPI002E15DFBB|nr:SDR family NAD(P)-dependent oxidoreductase [Dactylosporangium sp. NBC_01737]
MNDSSKGAVMSGNHGRTALVTGGTGGIGAEVAAKLRAAGLTVFVTGRDATRGEAVAAVLGATFLSAEHGTVHGNLALAGLLRHRVTHLDVLVNNVGGAAWPDRTVTDEGHEAVLTLNYLGPVALTHALLPALSPGATVVQVVSSAFTMHTGDPFQEPAAYTAIRAYARAKQLSLLAAMSLARRLDGRAVHVNAVNPGMAWTPGVQALTPRAVPAWRYIWPLVRAVQRRASPEKAARVPATLALTPDGTGRFHESNGAAKQLPPRLRDPALQDRAWQFAADLAADLAAQPPAAVRRAAAD